MYTGPQASAAQAPSTHASNRATRNVVRLRDVVPRSFMSLPCSCEIESSLGVVVDEKARTTPLPALRDQTRSTGPSSTLLAMNATSYTGSDSAHPVAAQLLLQSEPRQAQGHRRPGQDPGAPGQRHLQPDTKTQQ